MSADEIKKLLANQDFYSILGVNKDSTEAEIKKQYRKLALKYHPDKNKELRAKDAFKKVAQAYDCLTNPEKKAFYDKHGTEEPQMHQQRYHQQYQDIDPDDIFSFFFGGQSPFQGGDFFGANFAQQQRRRQQQQQHNQQQGGQAGQAGQARYIGLIQLLPILFLLLPTILSIFEKVPPYSIERTSYHNFRRQTKNLKINYFTNDDFIEQVRQNRNYLNQVEHNIEYDYIAQHRQICYNAQNIKRRYLQQANMYSENSYNHRILKTKAQQTDMGSCLILDDLQKNNHDLSIY